MLSKKKSTVVILLFSFVFFACPLALSGASAAQPESREKKPAAQEQKQAGQKTSEQKAADQKSPASETPADTGQKKTESSASTALEDVAIPIQTEKIDQAGQMLGKKIDEVGKDASRKVGTWITAKAFAGITWLRLIVCACLLLLVLVLERFSRYLIATRLLLKSTDDSRTQWWNVFVTALSSPLSLFIRIYGIYWAISPILGVFDTAAGYGAIHRVAGKVADIGGTVAVFWFVYRCINVIDARLKRWAGANANSIDDMLVPLVSKSLRTFIIAVGGIMVVQNMTGIEVGPLIASLGIGGLAFALAGKDSIANFFGSLTILLDKPFQVGERIVIDHYDGFVEDVGFRSTRLRTLTGNLVSIPNEKIINSPLENIGRRPHIRWKTTLTLTCDTPPEKVERAVAIVSEILDGHEKMEEGLPPRVYFDGFGEWSLNIVVFAWYHSTDNWAYQAWVQKTCLEIMRRFREEKIEFAFPTQTVYQVNSDKNVELQFLEDRVQAGRMTP
ncbi:MAG: mechanosensitive ion channel family protein [Syntrophobacteraceae bacterium]